MKEDNQKVFKRLICEMSLIELRELIAFNTANALFNKCVLDEAIKELRKRNEIITA